MTEESENYIIINGNKYNNWQDWCYNILPLEQYKKVLPAAKAVDILGKKQIKTPEALKIAIDNSLNNVRRRNSFIDRFRGFIIVTLLEEVNVDITEVIWNGINIYLNYEKK